MEMDEKQLVAECLKKNESAERHLYESNYNILLGICLRYLTEYAEAEDVVHDSFITIFKQLHRFQFKSSLRTWMTRIAINGCLAYLKKQKKLVIDHDQVLEELNQPEISEDELKHLNVQEILELLNRLPIGYKTVLCLYSIDGLDHREISGLLGISESSSRSQLFRARVYLRKLLSNQTNHG